MSTIPPPPPPMVNLKLGAPASGKSSSNADPRSALLQSIQKGTKLKKTTTVDKSGPLMAGRVANSDSSNNSSTNSNAPSRPPAPMINNAAQQSNSMPKLGGIFEGMTSMPKLKPVGARNNSRSPPSESPSSASSIGSPQNTSTGSAVGDLNAELAKHLTLKKQKKQQQQQQQQESNNSVNNDSNNSVSSARANRGPPPQPPIKNPNTTVTDNNLKSIAAQSSPLVAKQSNSSKALPQNGINTSLLPNKSSLFAKSDSSNVDVNSSKLSNTVNNNYTQVNSLSTTVTNKVVPNHGKPNCAPKPPGIHQIIAAKNNSSPNNPNPTMNNNNNNGTENNTRPTVNRTQSYRSPRSPPITAPGMTFPAAQQFGTIRITPNAKSQDAIHVTSMRPAPSVPISRPTVAPPRPPVEKNQPSPPPPPPPVRSVSNTNLSTLPLSVPTESNATTNFGGSAGNVSLLSSTPSANSQNNPAPPLPPHRLVPPVPPTRQTSITPASNSSGAPPVPTRHSSMRPNAQGGSQSTNAGNTSTPKSSRTLNRSVIDLDAKFGHIFHNVTEFPSPPPFQNLKNGVTIGM